MSMSLTAKDLKAIKTIVDNAAEDVKMQTAAGFAEVHEKIDILTGEVEVVKSDVAVLRSDMKNLTNTVGRIENVQWAEVARADKYGHEIAKLKKHLA